MPSALFYVRISQLCETLISAEKAESPHSLHSSKYQILFMAEITCSIVFGLSVVSIVLRVMCGILGILVVQENSEIRDNNAKILVVNYTTALDHLAMELVYPNVMVFIICFSSSLLVDV
jgi:hypothetical protein